MPVKRSYITIKDQFCGCGGSSQGAKRALQKFGIGPEGIKVAMNHWKLAVETHNTNFPDTFHDCADISASDPRRYPSTNILITSPECTTHSPAGGNNHKTHKKQMDMFDRGEIDPATERSRATMWDVCRFAEYHNYECIIVENVVEAKTRWGLFDVWLMAMHKLGYDHRCVYHNSMHHHPTPQSRDRMYVIFWKKGNRAPMLEFSPTSYCPKCNNDVLAVQTWKNPYKQYGKYKQQYVYCCPTCTSVVEPYYYAAFNAIDWNDPGERIGDRKKSLSPNTTRRINSGLDKYAKVPFIVNTLNKTHNDGHIKARSKSVLEQMFTQTTAGGNAMVVPTPFIVKGEHTSLEGQSYHRSVTEHFNTQTVRQTMSLIVPPAYFTESQRTGNAKPITDPLNTATAGGIKTGIVTNDAWNSFIQAYYGRGIVQDHISETISTINTKDRHYIINYKNPVMEDCYYRMLKPREIKMGMAFDPEYVILGNSRDQVKQCGNAVTPPVMEWLVERCIESLS